MPFTNQLTLAFTAPSVLKNAPAESGVYGLACARVWLYVGHTDNIQDALLRHLMESATAGEAEHPTGFTFELCSLEGRVTRQNRLVRELEPLRNRGLQALFDTGYPLTPRHRPPARRASGLPLPPKKEAV